MTLPLATAEALAEHLRSTCEPFCERIAVAGSIRRRVATVKDLELVAIPRFETRDAPPRDLFSGLDKVRVNLLQEYIESLAATGYVQTIKPGASEREPWPLKPDGKYWRLWLPEPGVKCDVFLPNVETWGLVFVIRTGSGVGPDGTADTGFGPALLRRWKRLTNGGRAHRGRLHQPYRVGQGVAMECACGWYGGSDEELRGPYALVCPGCGGSGGMKLVRAKGDALGPPVSTREEADVFAALEMPMPVPELRRSVADVP